MNNLLTDDELIVLNLLGNAWNKFLELPTQRSSDINEFLLYIHQAQDKILYRPATRFIVTVDDDNVGEIT